MKIRLVVDLNIESDKDLSFDMALWCVKNLYFRPDPVITRKLPDYGEVSITIIDRKGSQLT